MTAARSVRIIGPGRAGRSFGAALTAAGWDVVELLGRADGDAVATATHGVDLVLITTPDATVPGIADELDPVPDTVVAHVAGSLGLDVLAPHVRRAAVHPLVSLPNASVGAERLRAGAWFALAANGDPLGAELVHALGGRSFPVPEHDRARYHAAACIASNHLVALLGQVERVAEGIAPFEAYLDLVQGTVDNVRALGPAVALTGPAARGDWATIERHREALDPAERPAYDALVAQARRLVENDG